MISGILTAIQVISSVLIIFFVMLHPAKGEGFGGLGGGASQVFGSQRSAESGLNRLTVVFAICFMASSILLGIPGIGRSAVGSTPALDLTAPPAASAAGASPAATASAKASAPASAKATSSPK